ncbi:hypothetical protein EIP86_000019 [Pleurotus ostreatoroseus]|nr:hypothetical protein EIP86_000019 [Pleurotus ostreatoroseus]
MQNWYAESRERSTVEPSRSEPARSYEARATTYHDSMEEDRRWYANPDFQSPQPARPYSRPHLDHRAQHGPSHPYYDARSPYPLSHYSPAPAGPEPSSPAAYAHDALRTRPYPADLDSVAAATEVALPLRLPHAPAARPAGAPVEPAAGSAQKLRPSFKLQIPTPPPSQDFPSGSHSAAYHGSRSASYEMSPSSAPQSYPADPYFSPNIPASKQQSLYRMQTHASAAQNVEEKKHCCPHCNKRCALPIVSHAVPDRRPINQVQPSEQPKYTRQYAHRCETYVSEFICVRPINSRATPAFQCPYPGCNRKFNVNSNMRRHWRNHLSASRGRRDSVTEPTMPPTPPLTASASSSPRSHYTNSLPSSLSSNGSSAAYDSRSPSPQESVSESGDGDARMRVDGRRPEMDAALPLHTVSTRPIHPMDVSAPPAESRYAGEQDALRWRQRSQSSPTSRYREPATTGRMHHHAPGSRGRSNSCNVPGCDCRPISTTLRPAFPSTTAPAAGPSH